MKKITLALISFALSVPAFAEPLVCTVRTSTQLVSEDLLDVASGQAGKFGYLEGYTFTVTNLGSAKFEVQVFDASAPARGYAEGSLKSADDQVKWTYWSRDVLLEAACRLGA
jgi:hypothetical protein